MEKQVELYESEQKEANEKKYGISDNQCICCGKPMTNNDKYFVHMSTDWMAMHKTIITEVDAEIEGMKSQGYYPIGNSCAKKMPSAYIHKSSIL